MPRASKKDWNVGGNEKHPPSIEAVCASLNNLPEENREQIGLEVIKSLSRAGQRKMGLAIVKYMKETAPAKEVTDGPAGGGDAVPIVSGDGDAGVSREASRDGVPDGVQEVRGTGGEAAAAG